MRGSSPLMLLYQKESTVSIIIYILKYKNALCN